VGADSHPEPDQHDDEQQDDGGSIADELNEVVVASERMPVRARISIGIKRASASLAANRGSPTVAQAMRPRWGKANGGGSMSTNGRPADEQPQRIDIVYELLPSPRGTYEYEREDGTIVHGDASGEWTLDENGELEDIVFFMSPLHLMKRQLRLIEADRQENSAALHPSEAIRHVGPARKDWA
jgi:hypothetical protein